MEIFGQMVTDTERDQKLKCKCKINKIQSN